MTGEEGEREDGVSRRFGCMVAREMAGKAWIYR